MMQYQHILEKLKSLSNPEAVQGMARYGINPARAYGVSIPNLRLLAREAGRNHDLAAELWSSEIHEARILASMIDDPRQVTGEQMEAWALEFDSWDVCDQCCNNLFSKTGFAHQKAIEWSGRDQEFVKRAGFVLMATLAVHDKKAGDETFRDFLPIIKGGSRDERNFVKKAVNWALRQIGKRNPNLNKWALDAAREIQKMDSKSARWIAADAIRELASDPVRRKLGTEGGNSR